MPMCAASNGPQISAAGRPSLRSTSFPPARTRAAGHGIGMVLAASFGEVGMAEFGGAH